MSLFVGANLSFDIFFFSLYEVKCFVFAVNVAFSIKSKDHRVLFDLDQLNSHINIDA